MLIVGPAPLLLFIFIWGWCNESICALTRELCGELIKMLFRFSLTKGGVGICHEEIFNKHLILFKLAINVINV